MLRVTKWINGFCLSDEKWNVLYIKDFSDYLSLVWTTRVNEMFKNVQADDNLDEVIQNLIKESNESSVKNNVQVLSVVDESKMDELSRKESLCWWKISIVTFENWATWITKKDNTDLPFSNMVTMTNKFEKCEEKDWILEIKIDNGYTVEINLETAWINIK